LKDCEGDECAEIEKNIVGHAIEVLSNAVSVADEKLEEAKAKVESSEDLTEKEAAEALEDLDKLSAKLGEVNVAVEALSEDSSKDDVADAAKKVRDVVKHIKPRFKHAVVKLSKGKIAGIIVRSKQLQAKLHKVLERMAEHGKDTSQVEGLMAEFNKKIDDAISNHDKAVALLKKAREDGADKMSDTVKEAHVLLRASKTNLKSAHEILKDIKEKLKNEGEDLGDDELEDIEEEAEKAAEAAEDEAEDAEEAAEDEAEEAEDASETT